MVIGNVALNGHEYGEGMDDAQELGTGGMSR